MNKQQFINNMLSSAREVIARAVDNFLKDRDFVTSLCYDPFASAMIELVEVQRLTLNKWCCMFTCLHFLYWLKQNFESKYNVLLFDDADFSLMDSFVTFYKPFNQNFK